MKKLVEKLEGLLELGGIKKDVTLLVISGAAVLMSLAGVQPFPFDIAWVAIILCGLPIILEAVIGLVTAFDIKADVLVSMALIASVCIGEYFAAGEGAFLLHLGALPEELAVAPRRPGVQQPVPLPPPPSPPPTPPRPGRLDVPTVEREVRVTPSRRTPPPVWPYLETAGHVIVCPRRGKRDCAIMSIETHACMSGDYGRTMREVEEAATKWRAEQKTRRQQAKEAKQHDPCGSCTMPESRGCTFPVRAGKPGSL